MQPVAAPGCPIDSNREWVLDANFTDNCMRLGLRSDWFSVGFSRSISLPQRVFGVEAGGTNRLRRHLDRFIWRGRIVEPTETRRPPSH